jgi:hypothetical protein
MSFMHQPRTIEVPAELLATARAALDTHGPKRGGELLGISRNALVGIVATGRAMPGTIALIQQKQAQKAA